MTRGCAIAQTTCPGFPTLTGRFIGKRPTQRIDKAGMLCGCKCEEQMPKLINMKGRRGIVPPGAIYIGRQMRFLRLPRSKWANPFKIGRDGTRTEVITIYRDHLLSRPELIAALPELRGKDLACWCAPEPCHGEVLLELANS